MPLTTAEIDFLEAYAYEYMRLENGPTCRKFREKGFICWLTSWAAPVFRSSEALHVTATAFLDRLLEVGRVPPQAGYRSIEVRRQWKDIDVLLVVNGDTAQVLRDAESLMDAATVALSEEAAMS